MKNLIPVSNPWHKGWWMVVPYFAPEIAGIFEGSENKLDLTFSISAGGNPCLNLSKTGGVFHKHQNSDSGQAAGLCLDLPMW